MQPLIEFINSCADRWSGWMIAATLDSAALLILISLAWLVLRRHVAPQVGYGLFLLVPLKLIVPVNVIVSPAIATWTPSNFVSSWYAPSPTPWNFGQNTQGHFPSDSDLSEIEATGRIATTSERIPRSDLPSTATPLINSFIEETAGLQPEINPSPITATAPRSGEPRLTVSAMFLIAWLASVLVLLGRAVRTQLRFHKRIKKLSSIQDLHFDLNGLCSRIGVRQSIRIVETDELSAPAVWGILRPTLILPRGIESLLTPRQLQWVLLHELAHVRRRDLLVVIVQRIAAVIHFFNPVVWVANRTADQLREFACDDLADAVSGNSAIESSEAFVQILRYVSRSQQRMLGALGVLGWDSRASSFLRVQRLLDSDRPIRIKPNSLAVLGLLLLAALTLPHLRADTDSAPPKEPDATNNAVNKDDPNPKTTPAEPLATDVGEFELRVVGPDGEIVPESMVHLHGSTTPTAEQIRIGTFIRKASYGVYVMTDAQGRMVVKLPRTTNRFNVSISIPGFGPYWANWSSESHAQPIPAQFTAELEAGWTVGGIIVDGEGKPVAGAEVHPSLEYKKRPGDKGQFGVGESVKTDSAGKWTYPSVPVSLEKIHVSIDHSDFKPNRLSLPRSTFGIETNRGPAGKIVLDSGLIVTGKVTDAADRPIEGALIKTKFINDLREAKTGKDGTYRLVGCEPRMTKIVVWAKGYATDKQQVLVDPKMQPVNFQMQPGGKLRIRVLDKQDKPVAKARIFFQEWRGNYEYFEFGHINQYADEKGIWEWNEAPLDAFKADICPPDAMYLSHQPLIARQEEHVFRTPPALVISGRVLDAKTKQPIRKFAVVPGSRFERSGLYWSESDRFVANEGTYRLRHTSPEFAHLIRIEADGYQSAVSRDIQSDEGNVTLDFELKRGTEVTAVVLTPAGRPAAKAEVAMGIVGSQIAIRNGKIRDIETRCPIQETDESGRFQFPAPSSPYQLVILHQSGFAHVKATLDSQPATIKLQAWARAEGIYRVGPKPIADSPLSINIAGIHAYGDDEPHIHSRYSTTTGPGGQYTFDRVFPGKGRIGREVILMVDEGVIPFGSSSMVPVEMIEGETTKLNLGGVGRALIGKIHPPKGFAGIVNWQFALVKVESFLPNPPMPDQPDIPADIAADPVKEAEWMRKWMLTPAGKGWATWLAIYEENQRLIAARPSFEASVNRDGTFRIDDLPPGDFTLTIGMQRAGLGTLTDYRFKVPMTDDLKANHPIELGNLTLENK
ncbi:MAG: blaR1 2 [Planctomycetaceae bacterium]|nr:blaR1 2 [Planctomycetaceae bacterium]